MTIEAQINKLQDEITDMKRIMQQNFFVIGFALGEIKGKLNYLIEKEKERVERENVK